MREAARTLFVGESNFLIGVNGSYARREATGSSDVDVFFLATGIDESLLISKQEELRSYLRDHCGMQPPAAGGMFEDPLSVEQIWGIGGRNDGNDTITRRMLLLLEGEWVFNESAFHDVKHKLLQRYLYDQPGEDRICLFLLNDIIRYWRTMCVDFEHKISCGGKPWRIRLVKLRFSRMLLYVSGVLAIGQGYGLPYEEKLAKLRTLFGTYPLDRVQSVVGAKAEPVLEHYAAFLEALDTPDIRAALEQEDGNSEVFEDMRSEARAFRDDLLGVLQKHFADENPTIRALLL